MSQQRDLFGGAITCSLPRELVDASDLREVPDTQEVFLARHSDVSYIFDITESVEPSDYEEATKFHFESLAHDNEASTSRILELDVKPPATCYGRQTVAKFRRGPSEADVVDIYMALWRLSDKNTDLVFSMNVPRGRAAEIDQQALRENLEAKSQFEAAVNSFKIVDYGLFA